MIDRHALDWEELARREPYFAVLTDERFLSARAGGASRAAFFESGEEDLTQLLHHASRVLGRNVMPQTALDFGCGVGRLTLPLARRARTVVACDVAPTMLAHARQNAAEAGLANVAFVDTGSLDPAARFDFICSLLVFQHIPTEIGFRCFRQLLWSLAPGGLAALQLTFRRPGGFLRRLGRSMRARFPAVHRLVGAVRGDELKLPYMQMNEYDEQRIAGSIREASCRVAGSIPTRHGDTAGAILIIVKETEPA